MPSACREECVHWYCQGCLLRAQAAQAENNDGIVPKWIKCLGGCRMEDAFCPAEPVNNRLLIDLLDRSIPVIEKDGDTDGNDQPVGRHSIMKTLAIWGFSIGFAFALSNA